MSSLFFFGDSITFGAWDEKGGWVERIHEGVNRKIIGSDFSYYHHTYNLGIPGDNSALLLNRIEQEIQPRLRDEEDSGCSIILAIGINDSQVNIKTKKTEISLENFKKNIVQLIEKARKYTKEIIFVGLTPVDESLVYPIPWRPEQGYTNESIQTFNEAIKEYCIKENILFIDFFDEWVRAEYKSLLVDGLHPNTEGHALMYQIISQTLEENHIL